MSKRRHTSKARRRNPKRYSRQKRKRGKKHGSTQARLFAKSKHASRMMDRHETWDPDAKNRRRKKWRSAQRRTYKQIARHGGGRASWYRRNPGKSKLTVGDRKILELISRVGFFDREVKRVLDGYEVSPWVKDKARRYIDETKTLMDW